MICLIFDLGTKEYCPHYGGFRNLGSPLREVPLYNLKFLLQKYCCAYDYTTC